jgi:hypothetical protein
MDNKKNDEEPGPIVEADTREEMEEDLRKRFGSGAFYHLELSPDFAKSLADKDKDFFRRANAYEFWYAVLGLVVGITCVVGGLVLFLHGVTGSTSWTAKVLGAESQVSDAAPGVVFGILGFFIIYVTRYKVRVKD